MKKVIKLAVSSDEPNFKRHSKTPQYEGTRYGRLVVTKLAGYSLKRHAVWLCKCDCGNEKTFYQTALKDKTRSCGCLQKETGTRMANRINTKYKGIDTKKMTLIKAYKNGAKHRGYDYNLTDSEAEFFFDKNCYYCGIPPQPNSQGYVYTGIDRLDNTKGYSKDNCVPCCSMCNTIKMDHSLEKFNTWIINLFSNYGKKIVQQRMY